MGELEILQRPCEPARAAAADARSSSRPLHLLILLGLALAIMGWGIGYKLSHYNPGPNLAWKVSAARLWNRQQAAYQNAEPIRKASAPCHWELLAAAMWTLASAKVEYAQIAIAVPTFTVSMLQALLPFRSPPSALTSF